MTVDNPAVIDFVALTADGRVSLVAVEHREWDGSPSRLADLREKINRYVAYVIEGQLVEAFPEAAGKAVTIEVRSPAGRTQRPPYLWIMFVSVSRRLKFDLL